MTWPYGQVMPIPTRQIVGIANCWPHLRPLAVREPRHRAQSKADLARRRAGDGIFLGRYRSPVDRAVAVGCGIVAWPSSGCGFAARTRGFGHLKSSLCVPVPMNATVPLGPMSSSMR